MREHHRQSIEKLVAQFENDPRFLALIIGGSLARGQEKENSDVDIILVASDEEYARRLATRDLWYLNKDFTDYPDGYVDGKIFDLSYIRDIAARGSEPARAAFEGAFLAYNHIPELPDLIKQIPVFQEQERQEKMERFYSQIQLLHWFVGEAEKRDNQYLLRHSTTEMVLFGARLILEYNRILFPNHKWLMDKLRRAPEKPADMVDLAEQLMTNPNKETATTFRDCVNNFEDWGIDYMSALVTFVEDDEWAWRTRRPALSDW